MPVRNLDKIFRPQRVAVIGASDDSNKVGYTVLRNLIMGGFSGVVYPVNAKREAVQGIQAYPDVTRLPHPVDLAVICTPAPTVPGLVRQCGESGVRGLIILTAGFREIGDSGRDLERQVAVEAARFDGLRIIGPNCLGVIVPGARLNASFAAATPKPGRIAFLSQSGALCTSVLDWALEEDLGFSHFVSIGNTLDVGLGDLLDYLGADPHTDAVILYIESIDDARSFMSAARAFARNKPLVAYKSGRFAASAKAAASHTGALAGVDAVYEAAFERAGIVRVFEVGDIFSCAELLARRRPPAGPRLAILTNAGGPGVMATDFLLSQRGTLATLSPETTARLDQILPPNWSHGNPVDVLGDAPPERYAASLNLLCRDSGVDAVLVILTPQSMTDPTGAARAVAEIASHTTKPILCVWMGGRQVSEGVRVLNRANVPTYRLPEEAVRALLYLIAYARHQEILNETPRDLPVELLLDRQAARAKATELLGSAARTLPEAESKSILAAYQIPITETFPVESVDAAVAAAARLGYPVALKVFSPQITHKSDVRGVALNVADEAALRKEFARIVGDARRLRPDAEVRGVTVQPMVIEPHAVELIVGAKRDPVFGPVVLVGLGGTAAELFQDRSLGLPPLNERLARRMLETLKSYPLLTGYRGKPPIPLDGLLELLIRFSYLIADFPQIAEVDINPLLASPQRLVAVDARIMVDPVSSATGLRPAVNARLREIRDRQPFAHLAIRPYPLEFVQEITLADGTSALFRPIRPEDEPAWRELLEATTPESLRMRFNYLFRKATHAMASRYCFIDYAREMAIVVELEVNGRRRLVAVGRLVADPDHREAEYAVLVADPWQGRGLGRILTEYCLRIARLWQVERVVAQTTPDNPRMIAIFKRLGFQLEFQEEIVRAQIDLHALAPTLEGQPTA